MLYLYDKELVHGSALDQTYVFMYVKSSYINIELFRTDFLSKLELVLVLPEQLPRDLSYPTQNMDINAIFALKERGEGI